MSCIHYKFKSSLDYNSVTFDGMHLSLGDLKKAIGLQKRLKPGEFDLEITNAQTGDVYKKNGELIAKNTSVIVSRVPVNKTTASSTQKSWEAFKQECAKVKEKQKREEQKQTADVVHVQQASELDKIKAVINQSTIGFEPSSFVGKFQLPNESYVCRRCNQRGHFYGHCPNVNPEDRYNEPRIKRTTGIPSTMLTIVDDPMHPGALLTHHGQFAVPTVDVLGYREVKKERPPFLPFEKHKEPEKKKIPQELLCHICEDLCVDAAIAPCCGTSFCDECLREVLLESDDHMCPSCKETSISPDKIVPNRSMRIAVTSFLNDTGYTKMKKRRLSSQNGDASLQTPTSPNQPPSPVKPSFHPGSGSHMTSAFKATDIPNQSLAPTSNTSTHLFAPRTTQAYQGQFQSHYNYSRPPRYHHQNRFYKMWRPPTESIGEAISTISRRNQDDGHYSRSYEDQSSQNVGTAAFSASSTTLDSEKSSLAPTTSGAAPVLSAVSQPESIKSVAQAVWPIVTSALLKAATAPLSNSIPSLPLTAVLNVRAPPPLAMQTQAQAYLSGFPHAFPGPQPAFPGPQPALSLIPPATQPQAVPLSREEFYEAKKKKPVDVFESFADLTKRRSRTPERRRSYSRSRSGSWSKRSSRASSVSPGKRRSRSLTARRFTSRSRSRTRQRSQNRSRSKSGLRTQNRSRSRSVPKPVNRSRSRSGPRMANRSRSRSGPRAANRSRSRSGPRVTNRSRSRSGPRVANRSRSRSGPRVANRSRSRSGPRAAIRSRSRSRPRSANRSRSRSGPRPAIRSRSRSVARSTNRSRSRSFESSRLSRPQPLIRPINRISKSRSRTPPRHTKPMSPKPISTLSPLRRSSKSPLPPLRSRSRSFGRPPRSRSKSWSKRARSRSYSRPRSPRPLPRSPRRSPRWSPYRSPPRKRSFSPRRRSRSLSPRKKSFRSRSRSPLFKRRFSKSRSRSLTRRRSYSPKISPRRSKSPYRKPLSPVPLKRQSPLPFRGRGGYRGRGRGGYGFRDNKDKFRNNRSPPKIPVTVGANVPFSAGDLPPVPYFPQMGLPPPEEYFKYNPDGYQEFVRGFYAQFGPQAQAWAQSQNFPLPTTDRFVPTIPAPNVGPNPRPAWEPVPMSPSQRPRSLTPPGGGQLRDRKDQIINKDRDSHSTRHWEKDRERDRPDQERERVRDRRFDRGRGTDRFRSRDRDRDRGRDDDRFRGRDSHRERDFRETEHSRHRERSPERRRSPPRKSKVEDKSKDKGRKKSEKTKDEKEVKKTKKVDVEPKKESTDVKDSILSKTSPISDKDLESPKIDPKPTLHDSLQTQKELAEISQNNTVIAEAESTLAPQANVKVSKPAAKEKKTVNKKKGDGVGGKKKIKEASTEEGGEKKVKKTKKKKLTFGASDVDTKPGLKKKKLKRLVDYKSENCTSEDGEEKVSLGGSPLKKAKLADGSEVKEETGDAVKEDSGGNAHVSSSEPTCEICTEINPAQAAVTTIKLEAEAAVPEASVKAAEEGVQDKLVPERPELSKWEREDFDYFDPVEHVKEKPQEKVMLPRSVVDKAEKFLTHKPMKNAVIATATSRSPETAPEKQAAEPRSSSPPQSKTSRRVFIDHRRDSKDKKQDLHITVKTDKRKEYTDRRGSTSSKGEDHHRSHYHHHERDRDDYGEDQRSVVKSCSLERELRDNKSSSRISKDKEGYSRKERFSHESSQKQDSSRRDKHESHKDRHRDKSPEPRERKHDRESSAASHQDTSKSSKDLRHKLEEKSKAKSAVDQRKLSVMDEAEFVPDYEDLAPESTNDNERDDATASQNSDASTPEHKDKKKIRDNEENDKDGENKPATEEAGKKKSKKKHKHKEKKEKHKHKKKKHKHKKEKEGKQKTKEEENSS